MITYASQNGHNTFLSTNATKLTVEMAERLIRSGLDRVNLCMDGFSKEAQEIYRVRSDFDEVKSNIEMFLAARKRLGSEKPLCVLQTLLTSYSENQVDDITKWAEDAGFDRVRFKSFSLGSYTSEEEKQKYGHFLPTRVEYNRHPTGVERAICNVPLYQSVVFWNGDLGLCCIDYNQMVQLPNIEQQGFLKAYNTKEALQARKNGFLKNFEVCKGCSFANAESMGFKVNFKSKKSQQLSA